MPWYLSFSSSVTLTVLGFVFLNPLLRLLSADAALFSYCWEYAVPTLLLMPFTILGMVFQIFFITAGKARWGLFVSVLGGVTNIVLDYVLIAVCGWGIRGAAIATGIGYSIPALIGLLPVYQYA